jgi:microcystin-dependent protein
MSRNGSGVYSLPAGNPVVTNTTISSTWANTTLTNIASALTDSLAADGQTTATGNLKMGANRITGLADGIASTDATTKGYVDTLIAAIAAVPTGAINMWGTGTAPTGWLLCTGGAVSRTTYSALFAVIGTQFGVGDGSTTFNLPNFQDRMPFGVGTTATFNGATGGSKDAVVVSHNHTATVSDPSHTHVQTRNDNLGAQQETVVGPSVGTGYATASGGSNPSVITQSASTGITVANTAAGVSGTNANLPPYIGINFIIKI